MENTNINENFVIHFDDKVITADGREGRVSKVNYDGTFDVLYTNVNSGDKRYGKITKADIESGFANYYLIGHTTFGNKIPTVVLAERLVEIRNELARLKLERADLNEQIWALENKAIPDWREKAAYDRQRKAEKLAKKNGAGADIDTNADENDDNEYHFTDTKKQQEI